MTDPKPDLGYGSHAAILRLAVRLTTGPILELGCGEASTPYLGRIAMLQKRIVVSAETNLEWYHRFADAHAFGFHRFEFVQGWQDFEEIEKRSDWSVGLVDCAPGEVRPDLANRLAFRCKFVILHDTEKDSGGNYRYERCLGNFKHVVEYTAVRPYTMVCSNIATFPLEQIQ